MQKDKGQKRKDITEEQGNDLKKAKTQNPSSTQQEDSNSAKESLVLSNQKEKLLDQLKDIGLTGEQAKILIGDTKDGILELRDSIEISEIGAHAIAEALNKNKTLKTLKIIGCKIPAEGLKNIVEALEDVEALSNLSLNYIKIEIEEAHAIARILTGGAKIIDLNLRGCEIPVEGIQAIAEALKQNTALETFNLDSCVIPTEGVKAIAEALRENTTLTSFSRRGYPSDEDGIDDEGAETFAAALENNTTLTHLDFWGNNINSSGAIALANALKINKTLAALELAGNEIGGEGAQAFGNTLQQNTTISFFNLGDPNYGIGYEGEGDIYTNLWNSEIKRPYEYNRLLVGKLAEFIIEKFTAKIPQIKPEEYPALKFYQRTGVRSLEEALKEKDCQDVPLILKKIDSFIVYHHPSVEMIKPLIPIKDIWPIIGKYLERFCDHAGIAEIGAMNWLPAKQEWVNSHYSSRNSSPPINCYSSYFGEQPSPSDSSSSSNINEDYQEMYGSIETLGNTSNSSDEGE